MDLRGLCDPYVTLTVTNSDGTGGKTKRTKFIRQNLNPEYNEQFTFPVYSQAQILVVGACMRVARATHLRVMHLPAGLWSARCNSRHPAREGRRWAWGWLRTGKQDVGRLFSHETMRVQIKMYDHDDLGADDLIGTRQIPMEEVVQSDWQVTPCMGMRRERNCAV
jgi:hypothetical protein